MNYDEGIRLDRIVYLLEEISKDIKELKEAMTEEETTMNDGEDYEKPTAKRRDD